MGTAVVRIDWGTVAPTYERARSYLAQCDTVDEIVAVRDLAVAAQAYARQRDDKELEQTAKRIRKRAVRRLGEVLQKAQDDEILASERHKPGRPSESGADREPLLTLHEFTAGLVSKKEAADAKRLAAIPDEKFEAMLAPSAHVSQATGEDDWYTPSPYIEAARTVMGGIDLDPASAPLAQETVRAARFYTAEEDGLTQPWRGRVWLNPPYARTLIERFVRRLVEHIEAHEVTQACVLVNNATETEWGQALLAYACALCFPQGRVQFLDATGTARGSPLQGQIVAYIGERASVFCKQFARFGVTGAFGV